MGEGHRRLLSILLHIYHCKNGTVLIDEMGAGLHTSIVSNIWEAIMKFAKEHKTQIIATTHSYEFLQTVHEGMTEADMKEDFRYIRLDREGDTVSAKTSDYKMLAAAITSNWEVR